MMEEKNTIIAGVLAIGIVLMVSFAAFGDRPMSMLVIVALTLSLNPVLHGLKVSLRATQSNASFAHTLYFAENKLMKARTTRAAMHADIVSTNQ